MMWLSTIILFLSSLASAQENLSLKSSIIKETNQISLGYETSQIKFAGGTISGSGARASFYHAINETFGFDLGLSVAINSQNSLQNSFTALTGYFYYNLLGRHFKTQKKINVGNNLIASEESSSIHNLLIGLGLNQYFLNGNNGVYSASGFGAGAIYKINLWGFDYRLGARFSQLEAAQLKVTAISFDIGIIFSL
jgi:hypothetical protein